MFETAANAAPATPRHHRSRGDGGAAESARARIVPGPRTREEVTAVPATSVVIPPAAARPRPAGAGRHRGAPARREAAR
ncbi:MULTISPECIES: hypothetical protein [unclassified Streptomyces]|uniref:hypothetical protein n=1 Tax=unclassified Streptomyces TaxID=2593676 RepID=UPI0036FB7DCB